MGFRRVPVQGVTSLEGTLIRRYLGSLCSLLPALLLKPRPLPTLRPGVQIGPTASQGQHPVRRTCFSFVSARRPADVNRQGVTFHLALRVGSARDPKRNEPFKAALSQFLVARLAEAPSHETTIGA